MAIKVGLRGDTLIEVMLAVGIFSMVAVAVVSVMSGGSSSSQTALETTLAREEIDTQAETLRFIHRAYIADVEAGESSDFYNLWKAITDQSVTEDEIGEYAKYSPQTCKELYDTGGEVPSRGFVLDPRGLVEYDNNTNNINAVLYSARSRPEFFKEASTYPHLIYNGAAGTDLESSLVDHSTDTSATKEQFYRSEGLYLIAVRDPGDTYIAGKTSSDPGHIDMGTASAYYDFYIRTCWYGTGDQSPSSISTVIRLYNPDIASQE